jgi:3-hydroxyisobutyrate dehydrogenase
MTGTDTAPARPESVAVLGTGLMGAPMARHLARAGFTVRVWNRTARKAEALATENLTAHGSPSEAAKGAEALVTMLFDDETVAEAADEVLPVLAADALWLQTTTVGVDGCRRLADLAASHRVRYVDAPVVGTRGPAEQGALVVLASGPDDTRARATAVLDPFASEVRWLGPAGTASALKLVVNSWVLALTGATAEAVSLAEALGLDPRRFLDAIAGGPLDSAYAHLKAPLMMDGSFPASFTVDGAVKDAGLILRAAGDRGVDAAVTGAVLGHLSRVAGEGHGASDMAAAYLATRRPDDG